MMYFYKKSFIFTFKRQFLFCIFYSILLIFILLLSEFLFYKSATIDRVYGSLDAVYGYDYQTIYLLFIELSSIQAYIFSFAFFVLIMFVFIIFESIISYKYYFNVNSLLLIKGNDYRHSIYLFTFYRFILLLITIIFTLGFIELLNIILCALLSIKIGTICFVKEFIFIIGGIIILYLLINVLVDHIGFSRKKLITYIRSVY